MKNSKSDYLLVPLNVTVLIFSLSLFVSGYSCSTDTMKTKPKQNLYSPVQVRIYGCSQSPGTDSQLQIFGILIENHTKDTLKNLNGNLCLLGSNQDTLALITFYPSGNKDITKSTALVNGEMLEGEDSFLVQPNSDNLETIIFSSHSKKLKPDDLLRGMPDHFTSNWTPN